MGSVPASFRPGSGQFPTDLRPDSDGIPADLRPISGRSPSQVSKIEFKPTQSYITFEICCNAVDADDDEDVDVPYVRYKFRNF